ncbi:MAG: iron-containing alcohol dehydrogenase [Fusobacteriaceae bacterium]
MEKMFVSPVSLMGAGSLDQAGKKMQKLGMEKSIIVTCKAIIESGLINELTDILEKYGIRYVIYDKSRTDTDIGNVLEGIKLTLDYECDSVISFGGNATRNCAKGISLLLECDDEGEVCHSHAHLPLVAVNIANFMTEEMPIFVHDDKKIYIDRNSTPIITVTDTNLLKGISSDVIIALGIDSFNHSVESYLADDATPITDACAYQAIKLLGENLEAIIDGDEDFERKEQLTYANYLAGISYKNNILGHLYADDEEEAIYKNAATQHNEFRNTFKFNKKLSEIVYALGKRPEEVEDHMMFVLGEMKRLAEKAGIPVAISRDENIIFRQRK